MSTSEIGGNLYYVCSNAKANEKIESLVDALNKVELESAEHLFAKSQLETKVVSNNVVMDSLKKENREKDAQFEKLKEEKDSQIGKLEEEIVRLKGELKKALEGKPKRNKENKENCRV